MLLKGLWVAVIWGIGSRKIQGQICRYIQHWQLNSQYSNYMKEEYL